MFPELAPSGLVGIAKLAAESELIEAKRRVEYLDLDTRSFFSQAVGPEDAVRLADQSVSRLRVRLQVLLRAIHARIHGAARDVAVRTEDLRQSISTRVPSGAIWRGFRGKEAIAIGTATDPYQPAERRFRHDPAHSRSLRGGKRPHASASRPSRIWSRAMPNCLGDIARRNIVHVLMTITTTDERLARLVEPYAPRPAYGSKAIRSLAAAGVRVMVLANPVMPLITDSEKNLSAVASAAAEAGAIYMIGRRAIPEALRAESVLPISRRALPASGEEIPRALRKKCLHSGTVRRDDREAGPRYSRSDSA